MSDGGISFSIAFGYTTNELRRKVLVKPDWLRQLREARAERDLKCRRAIFQYSAQSGERPELPAKLEPLLSRIAKGEKIFEKWSYPTDDIINAIHSWNKTVDWTWEYGLGFGEKEPRKPRERRKAGYTTWLTPQQWLKARGELAKIEISKDAYTLEMWHEECEQFIGFLTGADLPNGICMDKNRPKLSHKQAGNILWYLQEVLGWVETHEVDMCTDCGRLVMTDRETHDWCSKCGTMHCESCTTAPYHCICDYPCAKHCRCKKEED